MTDRPENAEIIDCSNWLGLLTHAIKSHNSEVDSEATHSLNPKDSNFYSHLVFVDSSLRPQDRQMSQINDLKLRSSISSDAHARDVRDGSHVIDEHDVT